MLKKQIDKEVSIDLNIGEPVICSNITQDSFNEFIEYVLEGLKPHYGYDHIILAYKNRGKIPTHVAACKGKEFALEMVIQFNQEGLRCTVNPIHE
jgi:hypothetical protein